MAERTRLTPEKAQAFLNLLAEGNTVRYACKRVRISPVTVYAHRSDDPDFARTWEAAYESGTQVLEQEAFRRAVKGVLRPVYQGGEHVGNVREFSNTLLIFLLKARRPNVYRDTVNVEHYIREAARQAGINPDEAVAEAQSIMAEARGR